MNAFHWQGQPSIFTTGKGQRVFNGIDWNNSQAASGRSNFSPITLPNSSKFLKPTLVDKDGAKLNPMGLVVKRKKKNGR